MTDKILAIQIKGTVDAPTKVKKALKQLKLGKRHQAAILKDTDSTKGLLQKAKDYITYGKIDEETQETLETTSPGTTLNLTPPSRGFKNTKKHVKQGGSLGQRENINELLQKMA